MSENPTPPIKRTEVLVPGQAPKEITNVEITSAKEPWAEYELSDGTRVKAKLVIVEIGRVEGEFDEAGNPRYAVKATLIMHPEVPEALKKKAEK